MLLQPKPSFNIKLEDKGVYTPPETVNFPPFSASHGTGCDGGITWNCYKNISGEGNTIINNNNIYLNVSYVDQYNNSIHNVIDSNATADYNNNNNNRSNDCIGNQNYNKVNLNIGNKSRSCNTTTSQNNLNIPVFLASEKDDPEQDFHQYRIHHHHHHHYQQQQQQQHQNTNLSSSSSLPQTAGYYTAMSPAAEASTASATRITKSLSSQRSTSSNSEISSQLSASSPTSSSRPTVLLASTSSPMTLPFISSSSLSLSSPLSSLSPPLSSQVSATPSSFTETSYSTSDDKKYLVNNFNQDSILSTTTPSSIMNSSINNSNAKGSLNMINAITCCKAENVETIDGNDDIFDNNNNNTYRLYECLDGNYNNDFFACQQRLPDIWTSFGQPFSKNNVSSIDSDVIAVDCSDVSSVEMTMSNYAYDDENSSGHLNFETLQDVEFSPVIEDEFIMTLLSEKPIRSSCSEEDEDGSNMMSDCGYSSDPTTTQSSPVSNDSSSSDWSGPFENKLPVFEELQVTTPESAKRPRKRLTPSPHQKRKSTDSPISNEKERKKPGRKPGQVSNVLHLWEFMRDLLLDPSTSDGIIQWVSKADGVFRVVNSSEVARLWGQKKNNKKEMTYEKLSRSLRYSRLEGYFDNLPKDKNYPKKLCFKFGPKSRHFSTLDGSSATPIKSER